MPASVLGSHRVKMKRAIIMRTWRNWQTRRFQVPVGNTVWVQIPSSAPRLDGNFDTRKVSKLPSFLHKNGKKQGFEREIIVKTLLFGCAYFFYVT